MSTFKHIAIFLAFILCLAWHNAFSQTEYGCLRIKTELSHPYLWDSFSISNQDTVIWIKRTSETSTIVKKLKQGTYTVTLQSIFKHKIQQSVTVKKQGKMTFNTITFFKRYTDTASILNLMGQRDTAIIYYQPGGIWSQKTGVFKVVKEGGTYKIVIKNSIDIWIGSPLSEEELAELKDMLSKPTYISTLGYYYLCMNSLLVQKACGTCIYGFLLRKRLVSAE
ncbi:MAG: hypothetical protein V4613_14380 [Bacteroidota bacterium]